MAARVNVKFVVILASCLLLGAAGVALVAGKVTNLGRSADASIAQGDKALAEGDLRKAIGLYGRAVNKERRNVAYLNKWKDAMGKWVPPTRQAAIDAYMQEYVPALQALADAQRRDTAAFRALLDEQYQRTTRAGRGLAEWEGFVTFYDRLIEDYQGDESGKAVLARYRGLAQMMMLVFNPELSTEIQESGLKDLSAALAADATDSEVAIGVTMFEMAKAKRLRAANNASGADQLERGARARLERLADSDDTRAPRARLMLARLAMDGESRARDVQELVRRLREQRPAIEAAVAKIRSMPAEKVEVDVALQAAQMLTAAVDDGAAQGQALLESLRAGKGEDPNYLLGYARYQMLRGKTEEAIALGEKAAALPDVPLSLKGLLLYDQRAEAVRMQAEAAFTRWDGSRDEAERKALAARITDARKKLADQAGESAAPVLAIDARLALIAGDLAGARTAATRYNDQTNRSDPQMLVMEGELLRRTGNSGAARSTLGRVLQLDQTNLRALISLTELEATAGNFAEAARHAGAASQLLPENAELKDRAQKLAGFASGTGDDPVLNCMKTARDQAMGVGADMAAAEATLDKCLRDHPGEIRLVAAVAQFKAGLGKPDQAIAVVEAALKAKPDDAQLKRMLDGLNVKDQAAAMEQMITAANVPDGQKALARFQLYRQLGRQAEADAALAEAKRLMPEDPAVLEQQFSQAMLKSDQTEVARLVRVAEERNLDRVNGQLYRARAEVGRGALADAAGTLRSVLERDKLNFGAWQLLGLVRLDQGQPDAAAEALSKALEIRPDDVATIVSHIRALVGQNKLGEALAAARKSETIAAGNADFTEMFLQLEATAPGGDPQKAIAARGRLNGVLKINTPQGRTNRAQLASLYINQGKLPEAEALINELISSDSTDPVGVELKAGLIGRRGDVAGAVKMYRDFIEALPEDKRQPLLYVNASRLLTELGQPAEAIKMLGDGRKYQDEQTKLIDRELGDLMFRVGQYEGAAGAYRRVLEGGAKDENNMVRKRILECLLKAKDAAGFDKEYAALTPAQRDATTTLLAAEAASQANDREKARRLLDQAVTQEPKNPTVYMKRSEFNWEDPKMAKDVEADLEQVLRLDPNSILGLVRLSQWLRQTGRDDMAIARLRQALAADPNNESLRLGLVQTFVELGRLTEAAKFLDDTVQAVTGPAQTQWRIRAAEAWARVGEWGRTVDHMAILWNAKRDPGVGIGYARALIKSGRPADLTTAFNVLNSAELRAESGVEAKLLRAQLKSKQGQAAQAATDVASVLTELDQSKREAAADFMEGLTDIYPKSADRVAALAKLESRGAFTGYLALLASATRLSDSAAKPAAVATLQGLAANSTDPRLKASAWEALGTLAFQDRDWEAARRAFEKGLESDPANVALNNNMGFVLGTKLNRGEEAVVFAQKAVDGAPLSSGFRDTLGASLMAAGKLKQSETELNRALNLALNDGDRIPVYIHLGKLRLVQGDKLEARRLLDQARSLVVKNDALRASFAADIDELDKALGAP